MKVHICYEGPACRDVVPSCWGKNKSERSENAATVRVRLQKRRNGSLFYVPILYFQLGYDKLGFKLKCMLKCIGNLTVFPTCDCLGCFFPLEYACGTARRSDLEKMAKDSEGYFELCWKKKMQYCYKFWKQCLSSKFWEALLRTHAHDFNGSHRLHKEEWNFLWVTKRKKS